MHTITTENKNFKKKTHILQLVLDDIYIYLSIYLTHTRYVYRKILHVHLQFEGAYLSDGKGLNNWDVYTHKPGDMTSHFSLSMLI